MAEKHFGDFIVEALNDISRQRQRDRDVADSIFTALDRYPARRHDGHCVTRTSETSADVTYADHPIASVVVHAGKIAIKGEIFADSVQATKRVARLLAEFLAALDDMKDSPPTGCQVPARKSTYAA
jgi:hypothetical protein